MELLKWVASGVALVFALYLLAGIVAFGIGFLTVNEHEDYF